MAAVAATSKLSKTGLALLAPAEQAAVVPSIWNRTTTSCGRVARRTAACSGAAARIGSLDWWFDAASLGVCLMDRYVIFGRSGWGSRRCLRSVLRSGATAVVLVLGLSPVSVLAATLRVCHHGCRYRQIALALSAARNGDTILLGAGRYAGGVTIVRSVKLVGAGSGSTIISGGGSVLTIGKFGAPREPTVSIIGVRITGGVTRSSPESVPFTGQAGVFALGGGVEIPPNARTTGAHSGGGATVLISDSVITGNRVAPTHAVPQGPPCPGGPCPFALAAGGGIDNWGTLTLKHTTVSNNRVGSASGLSMVASDANGGAIMNHQGVLRISDSTIRGNQARATAPNGRFADSGAILVERGALRMRNSSVENNSATLAASWPSSVDLLAIAGGIHIGKGSATIRGTTISGNSVSMTNTVGNATAFSGGLHTDVNFRLSHVVIANNRVISRTLPGSSGNADGDSGAGEMSGKIANTRLTGNSVTVSSFAGTALASAGATIFMGSIIGSLVSDNHVSATSPNGPVSVFGGGLQAGGRLTLLDSTVSRNTGRATGRTGIAEGGGIFDSATPNGPPGGPLTLKNTNVTRNVLSRSSGITLRGGGVFSTLPVKLTDSVIAKNSPGQCFGC